MTFRVSAQNAAEAVSIDCPRQETPVGVALDYIDSGFSAVHVQDGKTGAAYGARFLLGYALARAQQDVRAPRSA
jgi:hypothetical protein